MFFDPNLPVPQISFLCSAHCCSGTAPLLDSLPLLHLPYGPNPPFWFNKLLVTGCICSIFLIWSTKPVVTVRLATMDHTDADALQDAITGQESLLRKHDQLLGILLDNSAALMGQVSNVAAQLSAISAQLSQFSGMMQHHRVCSSRGYLDS